MKGQKLLKVSGILMTIGGIAALAVGILAILGIGKLTVLTNTALKIVAILAILGGTSEFSAGIIGVKTSGMPSIGKIEAALTFGLFSLMLGLASVIYSLFSSAFTFDILTAVCIVAGVVFAILYLVAVNQFKKALFTLLFGN